MITTALEANGVLKLRDYRGPYWMLFKRQQQRLAFAKLWILILVITRVLDTSMSTKSEVVAGRQPGVS
jgi:hypothetical protein